MGHIIFEETCGRLRSNQGDQRVGQVTTLYVFLNQNLFQSNQIMGSLEIPESRPANHFAVIFMRHDLGRAHPLPYICCVAASDGLIFHRGAPGRVPHCQRNWRIMGEAGNRTVTSLIGLSRANTTRRVRAGEYPPLSFCTRCTRSEGREPTSRLDIYIHTRDNTQ